MKNKGNEFRHRNQTQGSKEVEVKKLRHTHSKRWGHEL